MADVGKKASPGATPPATMNVDPVAAAAVSTTDEARSATADESPRASIKVSTVWPNGDFVVSESIPVITSSGTMVTKTQLNEVEKSAAENGVGITVEEGS